MVDPVVRSEPVQTERQVQKRIWTAIAITSVFAGITGALIAEWVDWGEGTPQPAGATTTTPDTTTPGGY